MIDFNNSGLVRDGLTRPTDESAPDDYSVGWHEHLCPECDQVWECDDTQCARWEYECPTCHAETKGVEPSANVSESEEGSK